MEAVPYRSLVITRPPRATSECAVWRAWLCLSLWLPLGHFPAWWLLGALNRFARHGLGSRRVPVLVQDARRLRWRRRDDLGSRYAGRGDRALVVNVGSMGCSAATRCTARSTA